MPPLPAVPNVLRAAFKGAVGIHSWVNILHFRWSGATPSVGNLTDAAVSITGSWLDAISPLQDTSSTLDSLTLTDLTSSSGAQVDYPVSYAGSRAGDFLPANACFLVDYPVDVRYRGGHPRTYLNVGVWADLDDPATWSTTFQGTVQSAWNAFLAIITSLTIDGLIFGNQCAVSYVSKEVNPVKPYRRTDPLIYDVSGALYIQELASQRRRIGRK